MTEEGIPDSLTLYKVLNEEDGVWVGFSAAETRNQWNMKNDKFSQSSLKKNANDEKL